MAMQMEIDERYRRNPLIVEDIMKNETDEYLLRLVEEAPDVNIRSCYEFTPLHLAVKRVHSIAVALALIKKGADVDARRQFDLTPLHDAVNVNNLEAVCMLLYYNADVNAKCERNKVPFMDSTSPQKLQIAWILVDYHHECPRALPEENTELIYYTIDRSPIANELVYKGVDANHRNILSYTAITFSIRYPHPYFFLLLWTVIDHDILFATMRPFLYIYLNECRFSMRHKLLILYYILSTSTGHDLMENVFNYHARYRSTRSLLSIFFEALDWAHMEMPVVHQTILVFLTVGLEPTIKDVDWLVSKRLWGPGLLTAYYCKIDENDNPEEQPDELRHFLTVFQTVTETGYDSNYICQLILRQLELGTCLKMEENLRFSLRFFSMSFDDKATLLEAFRARNYSNLVTDIVIALPEFPTLLEISRNYIRARLSDGINRQHQFYDGVKGLYMAKLFTRKITFIDPLY